MRAAYRVLARMPVLARITELPHVERLRRAVREAGLVNESLRYAASQALEVPGLHRFTMRSTGREVWLGQGDSWVFAEIFRARAYDLPPEVSERLGPAPLIADLGANIGMFGAFILSVRPHARVVGYEPDPRNVRSLRRNLAWAGDDRYRLVEAAAADRDGFATFSAGLGGRSHLGSSASGHSIETRLEDVLPLLARSDLAKIDIEGGEWALLRDPRFGHGGPGAIALEFHQQGCPARDPETAARELLTTAGYRLVPPARPFGVDEFPEGQGMLWAIAG